MLLLGVLVLCAQLLAQTRTITGRVTDAQGNGIPNVSVTVRGTNVGTTTGSDGAFSLAVPANGRVLVISSVGYVQQEITIADRTSFDVALSAAEQSMEEVVVTAYGTARRRTFTGSVSQVGATEIGKQQISNLTRSLEGLVPGLKSTSGSGQPGAGSDIRIRGIGSINASSSPLYVVDGQPYGGDINSINPADIESISVLKDAASAALYGARGSNGVIMITTKKGKGKPRFDLQARYGINDRGVPEYDVIRDPGLFLETYWETLYNEALNRATPLSDAAARAYASNNLFSNTVGIGGTGYNPYNVPANQVIDPATGKLNPNAQLLFSDDWEEAMYENRPRQEYVGTLSGSSDKTRYYVSLGYLNDKGYVVKSDFTRVTARLNLEQDINKWLRFGANGAYGNTKSNTTQEGNTTYQNAFFYTRRVAPIYPVYLRDTSAANKGAYVYDNKGNRLYDFGNNVMGTRKFAATENPRATLDLDIYNNKADNLSGRTFAEFSFLPDLKLTVNYGTDITSGNSISFQNPLYGNAAGANGRGTVSTSREVTTNINQLLNYNTTIASDHNVDLLAGHESYKYVVATESGSKENFLLPYNPQLSNAVAIQSLNSAENTYAVESYFGQARYDFRSKYLLSGSFRRDGSSRFAEGRKWGTFWSVGAGYVISEETFMQGINFLNYLKLKASYGLRGNDNILYSGTTTRNFYPFQNQYVVVNNNGDLGVRFNYMGNEEITWEKNEDLDLGMEFRALNRLSGGFTWFRRKTFDLIFPTPIPYSRGGFDVDRNLGDMKNWGWEAELNADLVRSSDWKVRLGINATHFDNEITRLPEHLREQGLTTGNFKLMEGKSIYDYFTYEYAGVDQKTGEALYYKDEVVNGQPTGNKITVKKAGDATKYYLGKQATNDVYGGIDLSVQFRNFDFGVLTAYALGGYFMDAPYQALMYAGGGDVTTWHKDIANRWTPTNANTDVPKIQSNYQEANSTSDRFLIDGSYFSIRNITLGYSLSRSLLDRFNMGNTRFYLVADNVALFSKRKGLDPRQSFAGAVFNAYAPIRTISFGINTSF